MTIRTEQLRVLDAVPVDAFLERVAAAVPEENRLLPDALRQDIRRYYNEAILHGESTERRIATHIFDKLKTTSDVADQL